jgi:hypothetical protein
MKGWTWVLLLLLCLAPATALAGGGGNIRLSRSVARVAVGKVPIYLQALQHDVYPVDDALVTIEGTAEDGTVRRATGALDPAYGGDNVYKAVFDFDRPGTWRMKVTAKSRIFFPDYAFTVDVAPAGTEVAPLGNLMIMERGAATSTNHAGTALAERPAPELEHDQAPGKSTAAPWVGVGALAAGAGVLAAGAVGMALWRRKRLTH